MASRIDVDGGFECVNVDGFLNAALAQSWSEVSVDMSSLRKWWLLSRACGSIADLYFPRALVAVDVCSWNLAAAVRWVSPM